MNQHGVIFEKGCMQDFHSELRRGCPGLQCSCITTRLHLHSDALYTCKWKPNAMHHFLKLLQLSEAVQTFAS